MPVSGNLDQLTHESLRKDFESAYLAAYGRLLEAIPVRVMNLRVAVIGKRPEFDVEEIKKLLIYRGSLEGDPAINAGV